MSSSDSLNLVESFYTRIHREILDGVFAPGDLLLETVLCKRFGVSRTPIREALGRLAQDGYIERSTRGFRVRLRSPEEILDIYEARIALESTSAALAAERRTEFDLVRLTHLMDERRTAERPEFKRLNDQWHRALREAAHNTAIADLLGRLDSLLVIYAARGAAFSHSDPTVVEHDSILEAVRAGDAEAARAAMTVHLERMRDLRVESLARGTG
ncbi:GntR family transcriptional regulator [Streptomyces tremellae]|uniref:GntR family transcriptional regulator n=1 Tax=Streptomyces tremellae TaxID=1124239 RepID=A0ABP7FKJ1_9ACTN